MTRNLRPFLALSLSVLTLAAVTPASAQLSKEQLDKVRKERTTQKEGITYAGTSDAKSPTRHLYSIVIDPVDIDNAKAKDVFRWWSNSTGIPLVINWREMEAAGIDADTAIDLHLRNAPAAAVLSLVMKSLSTETPLLYETTEHYIRIFTKAEADKDTVTLVYDIKDLVTKIPSFTNAAQFDLNSALSNTSSGGSSGGAQSATTLFTESTNKEVEKTDTEKGEEIASLIRELIEPTIWQELGGQYSSIKYFNGRLVVKAPRYVHAQIGFPVTGGGGGSGVGRFSSMTPASGAKKTDIAGVNKNADKVAGIAGK
jgi:hypothetical protein